jgi:hypothetical protein
VKDDVQSLIEDVADYLLENPSDLDIEVDSENGTTVYQVSLDTDDRGELIGKGGRTAQALRSVIRASGALRDERYQFEILD